MAGIPWHLQGFRGTYRGFSGTYRDSVASTGILWHLQRIPWNLQGFRGTQEKADTFPTTPCNGAFTCTIGDGEGGDGSSLKDTSGTLRIVKL